jgi:hypothetical protein
MDYATLEEAYGSPFGQRRPITHTSSEKDKPKPEFTSIEKSSAESIRKNQSLINSLQSSLPLDQNPATENFVVRQEAGKRMMMGREHFAQSQPAGVYESMEQSDKLSRILRLIEQNRTGYERPAVQDIALYVFTGVFFLFTLDTFVELGKSMR